MVKRASAILCLLVSLAHGQDQETFDRARAEHLLNRAGFGGTPEECDRLVALGLRGAVARVMAGPSDDEASALPAFEPTVLGRPPRSELTKGVTPDMTRDERREVMRKVNQDYRRRDRRQLAAYRGWWMDRMVASPAPLQERMVLFWHGHFTSGYRDVRNSYHLIRQNELFRKHALGSFRTLLHAVSRDPAMLEYLDNNRNRKGRPNENFAREVMELFTLGVGNYTERDVKEAARAFTGWTFRGNEFAYARGRHDFGRKTVLGVTGRLDGGDVLDILLAQEAAPRWLAGKLLLHFMGVPPDEAMVTRYAKLLRESDWEVRPVLKALFEDPAFYADAVVGGRILGPVELLVGISRRLGERPPGRLLATMAGQLGQELLQPPNVKGWDGGAAWITSSTYLARGNFAGYLVEGLTPGRLLRDFVGEDARKGGAGRRQRGGGLGRGLRDLVRTRYRPRTRIRDLVSGARSAEEVVDRLCERLLAVPVTREARQSLLRHLRGAGDASADFTLPTERMLKRLARIVLSLPEAQTG